MAARVWRLSTGSPLTESATRWFNLGTGRLNQLPGEDLWAIRGVRVVGSPVQIQAFAAANKLPAGDLYQPGSDIPTLCSEKERSLAEKPVENDGLFDWTRIFCRVRVTRVVDGDTVVAKVQVPVNQFPGEARWVGRRLGFPCPTLKTSLKIRLYGIDAVEHDTSFGALATELTSSLLLNRDLWVTLAGGDKYGRVLGIFYASRDRTGLLNNYLVEEGKRRGIVLARAYLGGTKRLPQREDE